MPIVILMLTASATMPSLLLFWYFWAKDQNPEPRGLLLRHFLGGVFICGPVILVELWVMSFATGYDNVWAKAFIQGVPGAAIPEEAFKLLVLLVFSFGHREFDERIDGLVYGVTTSLGFATLENLIYVGGQNGGFSTALLRALTAVPCHAFLGVILGSFVTRARFGPEAARVPMLVLGLAVASALHGAYDLVIFAGVGGLAFPILVVMGIWARKLIHEARAQQTVAVATASVTVATPVVVERVTVVEAQVVQPRPHPGPTFVGALKLIAGGIGLTLSSMAIVGVIAASTSPKNDVGGLIIVAVLVGVIGAGSWLMFRSGLRSGNAISTS